ARAAAAEAMTHSGMVAGPPHYMSPEQARGEAVDHRADLFSLGSTLYAMCTGHPPFRAESAVAVLRRVSDDEPRPIRQINPDVPDWLEAIIAKLHAKEPQGRYQTASAVADLLGRCLTHVQHPQAVPLPDEAIPRPALANKRRRRRLLWAAAFLACAVAAAAGALAFWARQPKDSDASFRPGHAASVGRAAASPVRGGTD